MAEPLKSTAQLLAELDKVRAQVAEREQAERASQESEARYRQLFEESPLSLWEEDFSAVKAYLDDLRASGVSDLRAHFEAHPEAVVECASLVKVLDVNRATRKLYQAERKDDFYPGLGIIFLDESLVSFKEEVLALAGGTAQYEGIAVQRTLTGERIHVSVTQTVAAGHEANWSKILVSVIDITDRVRAEVAERDHRALAEALSDTAAALNSTLEVEVVLDRILSNVGRVVPHDAANIMLVDPKTNAALVVRHRGYPKAEASTPASLLERSLPVHETTNLRRMSETGQPLIIADLENDPDWVFFPETMWARSYVGTPIRQNGDAIGFLTLLSATPGYFTDTHAEHLKAFADQAAVAIHNARLYEQVQQHAAQLEALQHVTLDITAELELDALLTTLVEQVVELLDARGGGLYLYRPERDVLEWTFSVGSSEVSPGTILKRGEGLSGKVLEYGQRLNVDDYGSWEGRSPSIKVSTTLAVLGVPVRWGAEFLGVLTTVADAPRTFSKQDADLLSLFADQATVAIKNARLFDETRRHAAELEVHVSERTSELNAVNEELQHMSRVKDEFVANVSHELRTPLTTFKLYHKLMEQSAPEKAMTYVEVLQRETERLEHTIENLLRLSRLDQDRVAFNPAPVDLNALAETLVADRRPLAERLGLSMSVEPQPDLSPTQADLGLLSQTLSILMNNALNYTPSGGWVTVQTHLSSSHQSESGSWAGISVSDNGPGVPPDEQEKIFERFYRGEVGRVSKVPGTGLGLAIAQEIVLRHNGHIEVDSKGVPGEGATFTVWLPAEG